MTLTEATALISSAKVDQVKIQSWADLGCGSGLFSRALAQILPLESTIFCCDRQPQTVPEMEMGIHLYFSQLDFEHELLATPIDGILMANSLHFIKDKSALLKKWETVLKDLAKWIIIEYDTTTANPYVPYPIPFEGVRQLFPKAKVSKIGEYPSIFGAIMYACEVDYS